MNELKPCAPTNDELNEAFDLGYQACLHDNEKLTWDAAEELQQYRRAQPSNAPLTLDELLKVKNGAPLWMEYEDGAYGEWGLVCYNQNSFTVVGLWEHHKPDEYGKTWLAYRHKPKEAQHE